MIKVVSYLGPLQVVLGKFFPIYSNTFDFQERYQELSHRLFFHLLLNAFIRASSNDIMPSVSVGIWIIFLVLVRSKIFYSPAG